MVNFQKELIIGYTSFGTNGGMAPDYIQSSLTFNYAPGAVFNTFESFNGTGIGSLVRRADQGLFTEFIKMGGTAGVCYPWEPVTGWWTTDLVSDITFLPAYAIGYTLVDAIYMDMNNIVFQTVVVGDPLTVIAEYPEIVITQDSVLSEQVFIGKINIPEGVSLRFESEEFSLNRNSQIYFEGNIDVKSNTFNIKHYSLMKVRDLTIHSGQTFVVSGHGKLQITGELIVESGARLIIQDDGLLAVSNFFYNGNSDIIFTDNGSLSVDEQFILADNTTLTLLNSMNLYVNNMVCSPNSEVNLCNNSKIFGKENGVVEFNTGSRFLLNSQSAAFLKGSFILNTGVEVVLNGESILDCSGDITVNAGEIMCLNNNSILQLKNGIIHAGSVFNFLNNSKLQINGGSNILFNGTNSSHIFLQFGSNNKNFLLPDDPTSIIFNYTDVSNVIVSNMTKSSTTIGTTSGNLLFNNCTFRNTSNQSDLINISVKEKEFNSSSTNILDIYFNDCLFYKSYAGSCVTIDNAHKVSIKGTSFGYENEATFDNSTGLMITNSGELIIESCIFTKLPNSIAYLNPVITPSSKISTIENNYFNEGVQTAISVINSPSILIKNNSFNDCNKAVTLNHVDDALIFDNNIHKENCFGTGVDLISCGGILYQNNIRGYYIAVSLAMSSPQMGKNVISHNSGTGLYIVPGSFPFLSESYIENSGNYIEYPIAGYNTFFENGIGQNEFNGSEIYISGGSILLDKGCNSIYDDRTQNEYEYLQLISGERNVDISASTNYWGNHPYFGNDPSGRFFTDGNVYFEPYLIEPCIILPLGLQSLVFKSSAGDTIEQFEATGIINSADQRTILRSKALTEYFDGDYFNSFIFANQYSANYINTELDFPNLQNLLMLKKRITSEGFNELLDFYNQSYNNTNDSLLMYILKNLENQTNIASKNYNSALNGYIQIAETNPGNERGYYALIDAITTSFLNSDSTAGFGKLGKYHAANGSELLLILNNLLGKKDHLNSASSILPTEFHLFQNYPNPFNPVTRIVFDVPNTSNVTLEVYDLLGRQVATLINEVKEQGRYTVQFNASSLASGVYIYQMKAGKYVSTQKMLLLK